MKTTLFIGVFALLILSCASNGTIDNTPSTDQVNQSTAVISADISAEKFKQLLDEKPGQLLDVRTPDEFAAGNIEGAKNINFYDANFSEQLEALDKTVPVYVYCKSGGRSGKAKKILTDQGFQTVYNLIGGYSNWSF